MSAATKSTAGPLPATAEILNGNGPAEIRISADRQSMTLRWTGETPLTFDARFLRDNSQSAQSRKRHLSGLAVPAPAGLKIEAVRPIGAYAVNIVFSDGYDRGIYPWVYLLELRDKAGAGSDRKPLRPEDFLKSN